MILVTGASGHLGQWVVAELCGRGHDVLCASRRPLEQPTIARVNWSRPVRTVVCDLGSADALPKTGALPKNDPLAALRAKLPNVTAAIHLAAFIPIDTAANTPEDADTTLRVNASGTAALLHALSLSPHLATLVYASTFEVYGPPRALSVNELHPTEPTGYYGASKLAGEKYVSLFGADRNVPTASLRLPAIYGPGDTLRRAIGNFVRAAAAGESIVIQGDGSDLRELVYVADAAQAIVDALERRANGVFNVGSGRGISVREMAETVQRATGGDPPPIVYTDRVKPRVDYVLSVDRAKEAFGWAPKTPLTEGVKAQLQWVRATHDARHP